MRRSADRCRRERPARGAPRRPDPAAPARRRALPEALALHDLALRAAARRGSETPLPTGACARRCVRAGRARSLRRLRSSALVIESGRLLCQLGGRGRRRSHLLLSGAMPGDRRRLAFVVPRYGAEIVGGAETLARGFAERLADRFEVEVLTTCARDHHTWQNVLPSGAETQGGVTVRRFAVSPRDVGRFLEVQQRMSEGFPLELDEELAWAAGSVNSEALYGVLESERERFDALFFLPYLFGTTLLGTQVDRRRSVLIPCLHDEPFAYLKVVAHLFRSVRAVLFNSAPERSLARRLYGGSNVAPVVGFGFDPGEPAKEGSRAFRARYGIDGDYLLYFGRKEGGKNLPLLLDCFRACGDAGRGLSLVVAADGSIDASAG